MAPEPVETFYADARTRDRVQSTIREYLGFFGGEGGSERRSSYATMINDFYDVVTDFYEFGWGPSFHFATRFEGESFEAGLARAEYFLAARLRIEPGMRVLDVGCGVGGPMRNIGRFTGAEIVGVNNNDYQLRRLENRNRAAGLEGRCSGVKDDFMALKQEDESFDVAYAIEATCHAPDKIRAFTEIRRVLRPGGLFGGYEWCLTDAFDAGDPEHREVVQGIEEGNGLPGIAGVSELERALRTAGFDVLELEDRGRAGPGDTPWYHPLEGERFGPTALRRSALGRLLLNRALSLLEALRVAPRGATQVSDLLNRAADSLVRAGRLGVFTPSLFFLARRRP